MKDVLLKLATVVGSIVVALLLIEAFLVWDNHYPPVESHDREINGIDYAFLEPTGPLDTQAADAHRLLLLGDSFTAGRHCAAAGENVAGHLRRRLGGGDLEVVNLGVEGRDAAHFVEIVEALQAGLGPGDTAVLILYDNDIHLSEESCRLIDRQSAADGITMPQLCEAILAGASRPLDQDTWLKRLNQRLREVRTFTLVKEAAFNIPALQGLYTRGTHVSKWSDLDSDEFRWMVDSIVLIRDLVEGQGARFVLAYYPNVNAITAADPRHQIWRTFIDALARETGIETLDPFPYFVEHAPSPSLVWSLTDKHPNCTAHGIMAEFLEGAALDGRVAGTR